MAKAKKGVKPGSNKGVTPRPSPPRKGQVTPRPSPPRKK